MKRLLIVLCMIGAVLNHSVAQRVTIQSVEEAMTYALKHNVDLNNYQLNVEKSKLEQKNAKAYKMPVISGTFSGQRNLDLATTPLPAEIVGGEPGQSVDVQFGQAYNYNAGISINKELFNRGAALQAKLASQNLEAEELSQLQYEELLREQVSTHYYSASLANKAVEIGQQDLKNARQVRELTAEKYEGGLVDALVMNNASINVNAVRLNLNANKQMALQSLTELKKLFGMDALDELVIVGDFDDLPPVRYTSDLLNAPVSMAYSDMQLKQAASRLKISQSALLPTLSLNSYYGRQQFRDDFGLSLDSDAWTPYSYVSLNLNVPIFTGFTNRRTIKQRKLDHQIALNEQQKVQVNIAHDDARLIADYQISREDVSASRETYQLYGENKELTYQKFEAGVISLDRYLQAFADYLKAEVTYLNNLSKMYSYYSQIIPRIQS